MTKCLAVTTAGIALAAAFAIGCRQERPKWICATVPDEARINLQGIHRCQTAYKDKNGRFSTSLDEIGFVAATPTFYDVKIDSASEGAFVATATGKSIAQGDVWWTNEAGGVIAKTDKFSTGPKYCYADGTRSDD